jgi:hypothetical protein
MAKPTFLQSLLNKPTQSYTFPAAKKDYHSQKKALQRFARDDVSAPTHVRPAVRNESVTFAGSSNTSSTVRHPICYGAFNLDSIRMMMDSLWTSLIAHFKSGRISQLPLLTTAKISTFLVPTLVLILVRRRKISSTPPIHLHVHPGQIEAHTFPSSLSPPHHAQK